MARGTSKAHKCCKTSEYGGGTLVLDGFYDRCPQGSHACADEVTQKALSDLPSLNFSADGGTTAERIGNWERQVRNKHLMYGIGGVAFVLGAAWYFGYFKG